MEKQYSKSLWISRQLKRLYDVMCEPLLKKYRLSKLELDILAFLATHPELNTIKDISETGVFMKSNVSKSVRNLISRNYIITSDCTSAKRTGYLFLNEEKKDVINDVLEMQRLYKASILESLTEEEVKVAEALIDKMGTNINKNIKLLNNTKKVSTTKEVSTSQA